MICKTPELSYFQSIKITIFIVFIILPECKAPANLSKCWRKKMFKAFALFYQITVHRELYIADIFLTPKD